MTALALLGAACAAEEEPADEGTGTGTEEAAGADFLACQVTDTGGVDDKGFNPVSYTHLTLPTKA